MIVLATLAIATVFFILDLLTPSGAGEWGVYLIPLLLTLRARQPWYPLVFAGISCVLLTLGFLFSPNAIDFRFVAADRIVGMVVLWVTAILLRQRKMAEQALQASEARLRGILDHAPVAIFTKDVNGRYLEFNRQCEISLGRPKASILGRTNQELFGKEIAAELSRSDNEVLATSKAVSRESEVPQKDGVRAYLTVKFPLVGQDGKVNAVCGIATDITDLKRAELALRRNQERLDLAQAAGRIGTFDWIVSTGEVIWSQALETLYGLPPGGFRGTYDAWNQVLHPADRSRADAEFRQALADRSQIEHEFRIIWPDGSIRWIQSVARVLCDAAGEPQRVIGVNLDVTEPRHAQQALAFSLERLNIIARVTATVVGAATLAEQGRKLAEHARLAFSMDFCVIRILAGEELRLLAGAGIAETKLEPSLPVNFGVAREVMGGRAPMFVPDVRAHGGVFPAIPTSRADHGYISYAGAPLLAQDQVVGIVGIYSKARLPDFPERDLEHLQIVANQIAVAIVNDRLFKEVSRQKDQLAEQINERQRAESAIRRSEERFRIISEQMQTLSRRLLELQETERRHIARELHDEIGQALTALKINLQAVQGRAGAANSAHRLLESIAIVDRTLGQIRHLSLDLRPSMLDDLGLCAALRWYVDQQSQRTGLRIRFVTVEFEVRLDAALETACFRVAQEALTNIVRHARAGSAMVELASEEGSLHLVIRDDGVGFDLDRLRTQARRGASLGLLSIEERASLLGGRIEFKSAPGQGTEVHAWFPLDQATPQILVEDDLALR